MGARASIATYSRLGVLLVPLTLGAAVLVSGILSYASAVAAGGSHSCALFANGTVRCWGLNSSGQLGNASNDEYKPKIVLPGSKLVTPIGVTCTDCESAVAGAQTRQTVLRITITKSVGVATG